MNVAILLVERDGTTAARVFEFTLKCVLERWGDTLTLSWAQSPDIARAMLKTTHFDAVAVNEPPSYHFNLKMPPSIELIRAMEDGVVPHVGSIVYYAWDANTIKAATRMVVGGRIVCSLSKADTDIPTWAEEVARRAVTVAQEKTSGLVPS